MKFNKLYLTVLALPDAVVNEVKKYKNFCRQMIADFASANSKAHITIRKETPERPSIMHRKVARMKQDLQHIPAMKLRINGFGYFENGAGGFVIFAKLESSEQVTRWLYELKTCCDTKDHGQMHITIARGLTARQFNLLWPYFKDRQFSQTFMAHTLTILEKDMLADQHSKTFATLSLGHKDVALPQAWTLFSAPVYAG